MRVGEQIQVEVNSAERYSANKKIVVNVGEIYEINVNKNQYWYDSYIKTDPDGFFNPLLTLSGRRVNGVKCFCLCGTIDMNEENHFKIGSGTHHFTISQSGILLFFANDSIKHYYNNRGIIYLDIKRIG